MELCIAIAEGTKWLGFQCRKGRVLYVNLEIDPASAINRFLKIYEALHLPMNHSEDIEIWNLRGHAIPLDQLVPRLINRVKGHNLDAIIIDPIYKVITGDENNASEMGQFCNQFDKICSETGCASIYCHHHSKGAQGAKRAMDRASGSGVFARDADAQLDMIQLELSDDLKNNVADGGATAWRLESSLREFQNITPVNFWFEYPIHRLDESGELTGVPAEGSMEANLSKSSKRVPEDEQRSSIETAYSVCQAAGPVSVKDMAEYLQIDEKTVRRRIKKFDDQYFIKNGIVFEVQDTPSD
jgi:RecA-family ATPase